MKMLCALLGLLTLVACTVDKAEPELRRCEALEAEGKLIEALVPCSNAANADPQSKSGLAARVKIETVLQPARDKQNAEKLAAYEKAHIVSVQNQVAALKKRVKKKFWEVGVNGECAGKGYPPFRWDYEGGTFEEDNMVALADGCTKLHRTVELQTYCCPQQP